MVAQAQLNGTAPRFYSDAEMRDAVRAYQAKHELRDDRVAQQIGISLGAFDRWMGGTPSYTVARQRLIRFCRGQNLIPEPTEIAQVAPEPEPQRSLIAYMADREPDQEQAIPGAVDVVIDAVLAAAAEAVTEPEPPAIDGVFVDTTPPSLPTTIIKHSPFPDGFALVWNAPTLAEPAIRIADSGVLLNKALREEMGEPGYVQLACWSARDWSTARIAVTEQVPQQLAKLAISVPKSGELSKRTRDNLAGSQIPNGTYAVTKEGDCWITGEIALNPVHPKGALA